MSRTNRNINYMVWGQTKREVKKDYIDYANRYGSENKWTLSRLRDYQLYGTDSRNFTCSRHEFFNQAHRVGRTSARNQLRPHQILEEDWDFDPSAHTAKYRGVWWDIF